MQTTQSRQKATSGEALRASRVIACPPRQSPCRFRPVVDTLPDIELTTGGRGMRFADDHLTLASQSRPEILRTRQPLPRERTIADSEYYEDDRRTAKHDA